MRDEVLLALDLDGTPLSAEHGGPVRALVGGWYGMASVKWVTHLTVIDGPHDGHWETVEYASAGLGGDGRRVPVTEMQPKAQITSPAPGVGVAGPEVVVRGLAWAGEAAVAVVEISDDGGGRGRPRPSSTSQTRSLGPAGSSTGHPGWWGPPPCSPAAATTGAGSSRSNGTRTAGPTSSTSSCRTP